MKCKLGWSVVLALLVGHAAEVGNAQADDAGQAAAEPQHVLKLWPQGAPGDKVELGPEKILPPRRANRVVRLTNVSDPTISVYAPPADKANGCAVVICPGGGYSILAMDLEGTEIAQWLNTLGVTGIVLKYRVPSRDRKDAPLQDVQRAIRLARQHARQWNIAPQRIGVLGFSAGGHLTVMAGTRYDEPAYKDIDEADKLSARPDFMVPIYAAYLGAKDDDTKLNPELRLTKETPPTFLAVTADDKMRGVHAALLFAELKKLGVPAEVHVYTNGGHGYGLRPSDRPVSSWNDRCGEWLRDQGLLKPTAGN